MNWIVVLLVSCSLCVGANYPLKLSANRRYLVDNSGNPFLIYGDAPHSILANAIDSDIQFYFQNRATNGFNSVWVELLTDQYINSSVDSKDKNGDAPFTSTLSGSDSNTNPYYDYTTPNSTYWNRVDSVVTWAGTNGLQVLMDSIETGGRQLEANRNGSNRCWLYGQFLGNRYKDVTNIIWITGNDFFYWGVATNNICITAIVNGIKSADTNHLHCAQLNMDDFTAQSASPNTLCDIITVYTYQETYDLTLQTWNANTNQAVMLSEAHYSNETNAGDAGTPPVIRKQAYWSLLSGALCGWLNGNYYTWTFFDGGTMEWKKAANLNSPDLPHMRAWTNIIGTHAWYTLVPDQNHKLVSAGYGTRSTGGVPSDSDYATAAFNTNGTLGMVYTPASHTLTVNMTNFSGSVTSRWFDPTANSFTAITGSPFTNTITTNLTTPGNNTAGDGDWVLLLESQGGTTNASIVKRLGVGSLGVGIY